MQARRDSGARQRVHRRAASGISGFHGFKKRQEALHVLLQRAHAGGRRVQLGQRQQVLDFRVS